MLNGSLTEEEQQIIYELDEITKRIYKQYKRIRKLEIDKKNACVTNEILSELTELIKKEKEIYAKIKKDRVMYFLGYYFGTQDTTQIFLKTDNYHATEFYDTRVVLELINILYSTDITIINQLDKENNVLNILRERFKLSETQSFSAIRSINIGNEIERDLKRLLLLFLQESIERSKNLLAKRNLIVDKYIIIFNDRYLESEVLIDKFSPQNLYLSSRLYAEFFNIPEQQYYKIKESIITKKWIETVNELLSIKDDQFEHCLGHVLFLQCQLYSLLLLSKKTANLFLPKVTEAFQHIENKSNRKAYQLIMNCYQKLEREKVKELSFGKYKRTL